MTHHVTLAAMVLMLGCSSGELRGGEPSVESDVGVADDTAAINLDSTSPTADAATTPADSAPSPIDAAGKRLKATVRNQVVSDAGQGWCSVRYVKTLKKFLAMFVNHYSPSGYQNNSLRAFDPATNKIEVIHPKDVPGTPTDRNNHNMIYNPFTNQVWMSGGSHVVLDVAKAYENRTTPPSYGAVGWWNNGEDLSNGELAGAMKIKDWPSEFRKYNAVVDWHTTLDIGVIWGGAAYTGMGVSNDLFLLKPATTPGSGSYTFVNAGNWDGVLAPPGYVKDYIYETTWRGRHNGRILGDHFYTLSISKAANPKNLGGGKYAIVVDLLRFDLKAPVGPGMMTKMAQLQYEAAGEGGGAPAWDSGMYYPCVTADTRLGVLLVRLGMPAPNSLFAYSPATDSWQNVPTDVPLVESSLQACDYSPDHRVHAYQDGLPLPESLPKGWSTISLEVAE